MWLATVQPVAKSELFKSVSKIKWRREEWKIWQLSKPYVYCISLSITHNHMSQHGPRIKQNFCNQNLFALRPKTARKQVAC
jgi:hypothetical protein